MIRPVRRRPDINGPKVIDQQGDPSQGDPSQGIGHSGQRPDMPPPPGYPYQPPGQQYPPPGQR